MRTTLLVLNALVVGGCIALWLVRAILMQAFMDEPPPGRGASAHQLWEWLSPLYGGYGLALAVLIGISTAYWVARRLRAERDAVR